jgi:glutathione S-transferase
MLTLLTYPGTPTAFSLSPFCVKAAMLLARSGLPWQREDLSDPRKMPHQKLPVLKTPERLVADSDGIRDWLEEQGLDFDEGLSPQNRARARALTHMAEDHLYFHAVQDRWNNDAVWPAIRDSYFSSIPGLLRGPITRGLRKTVQRGLGFQGTARFAPHERMHRVDKDLRAVADLLQDHPFLMGDAICSADLSMGPMLAALAETPVETDLTRRVTGDAALTGYIDRVRQTVPLP